MILQSALLFTLFYLGYYFLLRPAARLGFNRAYLLLCYPVSLILPLLPWARWWPGPGVRLPVLTTAGVVPSVPADAVTYEVAETVGTVATPPPVGGASEIAAIDYWAILDGSVYALIAGALLLAYALRLLSLYRRVHGAETVHPDMLPPAHRSLCVKRLVTDQPNEAFTFGRTVYLNDAVLQSASLPTVLAHEGAHVRQGHTVDLILSEIITALAWLHPVAWLHRRALRLNLEFLADRAACPGARERKPYAYLLMGHPPISPTPALSFFAHPLKTRIMMLGKAPHTLSFSLFGAGTILGLALALAACTAEPEFRPNPEFISSDGTTEFYLAAVPTTGEAKSLQAALSGLGAGLKAHLDPVGFSHLMVVRGESGRYVNLTGLRDNGVPIRIVVEGMEGEVKVEYYYDRLPPGAETGLTAWQDGEQIALPRVSGPLVMDIADFNPSDYAYHRFDGPAAWEEAHAYLASEYSDHKTRYYLDDGGGRMESMPKPHRVHAVSLSKTPAETPTVRIKVARYPNLAIPRETDIAFLEETLDLVDCHPELGCQHGPGAYNAEAPFAAIEETVTAYFPDRPLAYHIDGRRVGKEVFYAVEPGLVRTIAYAAALRSTDAVALNLIRKPEKPTAPTGMRLIMKSPGN